MQLNETETLALQTSKKIRDVFGIKMDSSAIYDVVDNPNHRAFKIKFIAYDYFGIQ